METIVFPLVNITLFPKATKPLNIFEPRYIAMVKDSVQNQIPMAIAYIDETSKISNVIPGEKIGFIRDIAGYGYPQIVEERSNGTLLIFIQGVGKVQLGKVLAHSKPYILCDASIIYEENSVDEKKKTTLESIHKILIRWIETHIPDALQREIFLKSINTSEEIVGTFSSYLIRDYDLQQMALEFNNINDKIDFLHRLIESNELTN